VASDGAPTADGKRDLQSLDGEGLVPECAADGETALNEESCKAKCKGTESPRLEEKDRKITYLES
jgi:hypothetical protein